ncbi:glycosyl hydrolase [Bailinhaonella thermotolerans]|uniref:Glycosyl hydrolase n=2 Tax=Bailinhaonella thermotolerans TaxID=1070861 RepID=A0A3A4AWF4_9ACTN|nr:glycosyl hydrolase [Bailinhaonella thermotolerans]
MAPQGDTAGRAAAPEEGSEAVPERCKADPRHAKRQLRGVWIASYQNIDWPSRAGLPAERQRAEYVKILDTARKRGLNAAFVHVRPTGDALYDSPYEPWSQWLTGTAGKNPGWDPLPFLIEEAHKRGMEFHAWFNPYRISAKLTDPGKLPAGHPAREHPSWTVKYAGGLYYNPGLPEVRAHVTKVIKDVVSRYDVDAVHFDDYFYPYPAEGVKFDDDAAFKRYGKGMKLADWRRDNVNRLVAQVHRTIHDTKEHVRFGISPFGIWRNKGEDRSGSDTKGLSGYDAIYGDARTWIKKGTVDYIVPQLYWPIGHKAADYRTLVKWWSNEVKGSGVDLYIGQGLYRVGTTDDPKWRNPGELPAHLAYNRRFPAVKGDVYFSAKQVMSNPSKVFDRIGAAHYDRPALVPATADGRGPEAVGELSATASGKGAKLTWQAAEEARAYAVYRLPGSVSEPGCKLASARDLVAVVPANGEGRQSYTDAGRDGKAVTYFVTPVDRQHREGKAQAARVS